MQADKFISRLVATDHAQARYPGSSINHRASGAARAVSLNPPHRARLPQSVWQSAAELARCHGLYVVAHSLRLDYSTLKKHVSGSPAPSRPRRKKTQPRFVELIGGACERVDEYVIEFESARGPKLRIHCKTVTPPDGRRCCAPG